MWWAEENLRDPRWAFQMAGEPGPRFYNLTVVFLDYCNNHIHSPINQNHRFCFQIGLAHDDDLFWVCHETCYIWLDDEMLSWPPLGTLLHTQSILPRIVICSEGLQWQFPLKACLPHLTPTYSVTSSLQVDVLGTLMNLELEMNLGVLGIWSGVRGLGSPVCPVAKALSPKTGSPGFNPWSGN